MLSEIKRRVLSEANYAVFTGATVRQIAEIYGVGKSTVHSDLTKKLKYIDDCLYKKVRVVLDKNLAERHIRGGEATRHKYKDNPT